ncbi:MAG: Mur ligase family protein, partial [candidate division KSB1 bacterium]|nr:Mur ligase family protein [candidate division KSB1 bacterium]
ERENARPERGDGYSTPLARIVVDEFVVQALAEQGYTLESVLPAGRQVRLNYQPPAFETGGRIVDVTDRIHPQVAARVLEATRLLRLDVAGIDLVAEDISRPLEQQGGMILEVNVGPAIWLHMAPWCDRPRPVAEAIVASVIPEGDDGRIPIAAVTGVNGKTTTTWLVAHLLRTAGRKVGMACTDGMFIEGRQISAHDCSGPRSARAILRNPAVDAAVLETARGGILREGLGFDWCDVAVVTNIGEGEHLGLRGVHTPQELAQVKATLVKAVSPKGCAVLNAADPLVAAMAPHSLGEVIYFCADDDHPVVRQHLSSGGRAVVASQGWIVLCQAAQGVRLTPLEEVPMTLGGKIHFQVENALAGVGAAWALGVDHQHIRHGLASFVGSPPQAPGRFNVFKFHGATVIVDFAHNASALAALARALDNFPHRQRTIVYGGCDRRDEDVIRQGEVLGLMFAWSQRDEWSAEEKSLLFGRISSAAARCREETGKP